MQEIITKVYNFDELNEKAQARALDWVSEAALSHDWFDTTQEDAGQVGVKIVEFDLYRRSIEIRLTQSAIDVALNIKNNHGPDCETAKLAAEFIGQYDVFHGINGKLTLANKDEDFPTQTLHELEDEWQGIENDFTQELGEEYLALLHREYEYLSSAEALKESIEANEYTFTEDGKRFG